MNNSYNYYPMIFNESISNQNITNKLYGSYEGFIRGNMFRDIYNGYKDYVPQKLIPKTQQEEELLNLNQIQFAMHEANLYLDVFPDDASMMREFVKYRDQYSKLLSEYERKYGAININSNALMNTPFDWENSMFSWDRRGL